MHFILDIRFCQVYNPFQRQTRKGEWMQIQTVNEIVGESGINALLYGQDHSGKTYSISTLPALDKVLILSVEPAGLISIRKKCGNMSAVRIDSIETLKDAWKLILDNPGKYETVVIDSLSEIADLCVNEELERTNDGKKVHGQAAYGEMATKIIKMVRAFIALPCNVIFICQQGRIMDADNRMFYGPLFPGAYANKKIPYLVPFIAVLRLKQDGDSIERCFQFIGNEEYIAGQRGNAELAYEKPNWTNIFNKINNKEK